MDLALHLGMTAGELEQKMSAVEFSLWQRYANRRMLPWRRMEMYLAQVAHAVSGMAGGDSTLSDFLFDPPEDVAVDGDAANDAVAFFSFAPRATLRTEGNV